GIVRLKNPSPETIERDFLNKTYPKPGSIPPAGPASPPNLAFLREKMLTTESPGDYAAFADAELLWGGSEALDRSIDYYREAFRRVPEFADAHFRLGVAYRMRYDSSRRQPGDFQKALIAWQDALDLNADQYIWRRRIQQYGPRLDKPYPFYDWI